MIGDNFPFIKCHLCYRNNNKALLFCASNTWLELEPFYQAVGSNTVLLFHISSRNCIQSQFEKPTSAFLLYAARDGQLSAAPLVSPQQGESEDWRRRRQTGVYPNREPHSDGVLLKFPQVLTVILHISAAYFSGLCS